MLRFLRIKMKKTYHRAADPPFGKNARLFRFRESPFYRITAQAAYQSEANVSLPLFLSHMYRIAHSIKRDCGIASGEGSKADLISEREKRNRDCDGVNESAEQRKRYAEALLDRCDLVSPCEIPAF